VDVKGILKRESQLNLLAYLIILALLVIVGMLVYVLLTGTKLPDTLPLTDNIVRTLLGGLTLGLILYLADQHRRLRKQLIDAHDQLEQARVDVQTSYDRLAFAHYASTVMTSLDHEDALSVVLREATRHYEADAAGVVGDEITIMTREGVSEADAHDPLVQTALEAVRAGKPLSTERTAQGGSSIAVPLRVGGRLQAVACLWRREGVFTEDQLQGLGLLARIIELSMENRELLGAVRAQLEGTVEALGFLVEDLRPHYTEHALAVASTAERVGAAMGMTPQQRYDLRMAGLLHDVGVLRMPAETSAMAILGNDDEALRRHPERGAELARVADFSVDVQNAVMTHHEALDGSGYPKGLGAAAIPVSGRILAVAEAYDTLTRSSYNPSATDAASALRELEDGAGSKYDPQVLRAFRLVLEAAPAATSGGRADATAPPFPAAPAQVAAAPSPSEQVFRSGPEKVQAPPATRPQAPPRLGLGH
jgi:putative nucleotidyltransferase with HDIG domain